jgi:D-alanine-D-alanine ligase-like ATP-grasp enzyme
MIAYCFKAAHHNSLSRKTGCFEFMGADIMIDQDLNPYLIEINVDPSLMTDCKP